MKKCIIILIGLLCFTSAYAQKQIKGISTYFPSEDSIVFSLDELNYLIKNSYVVCSKIDILDDGYMVKTIQMSNKDTTFRFLNVYIESDLFTLNDLSIEKKVEKLRCAFAIVSSGELYEVYELNYIGKQYLEALLNKTKVLCYDPYE